MIMGGVTNLVSLVVLRCDVLGLFLCRIFFGCFGNIGVLDWSCGKRCLIMPREEVVLV